MGDEIQIFVGNDSLELLDFYPDDLPEDWRFDYYSSRNNASILRHDSNEDFEDILENIDEEFKLVIDVSNITNIDDFSSFIQPIHQYKEDFIVFANTDDEQLIKTLQSYNFCIYSNKIVQNCKNYNDCYFNNYLVVIEQPPENEMKIRERIEYLATLKEDVVFIQKNSDIETLEKTRIIIDLLGFY